MTCFGRSCSGHGGRFGGFRRFGRCLRRWSRLNGYLFLDEISVGLNEVFLFGDKIGNGRLGGNFLRSFFKSGVGGGLG